MFRSDINSVVIDRGVFHRSRDIDAAGAVILTDVVADDGSGVAGALGGIMSAFIANEKETAVVIVAVVVLDRRVSAVPIGVEAFSVALAFGAVRFVVLNQSVVRAPGPDRDVVPFRALVGVPYHVVFHHCTVRGYHDDAVPADVVQGIAAHHHAQARIPLRPDPRVRPTENPAPVDVIDLVILNPQIHKAARLAFAHGCVANPAVWFHAVHSVHVVDRQRAQVNVMRLAVIFQCDVHAAPLRSLRASIGDLQVRDFPILLVL